MYNFYSLKKYTVVCVIIFGVLSLIAPITSEAFSVGFVEQHNYDSYDQAGLFSGFWHGMIAPYSLLVRIFTSDIDMYAYHNTGWFYDLGFLIGIIFSIPIGWLAAMVALLVFVI